MLLIKTLIFLFFCSSPYLIAKDNSKKSDYRKLNTKIRQTYLFNQLPDDGSYCLEIKDIIGDVIIKGTEGFGAKINIIKYISNLSNNEIESAHKLAKYVVKHIEKENIIQITDLSEKSLSSEENILELELPININLKIKILGGDIKLNNIRGESTIETLGGYIHIENYVGDLDLKTNGDNIKVKSFNGFLRSHSSGGNINIDNAEGELFSSTVGGNIYIKDLKGGINSQTSGGSIDLIDIIAKTINCRASGGYIHCTNISGQKTTLHSLGNGITVINANGDIVLNSDGGSINVKDTKGSLKCEASSGNIEMIGIVSKVECINASGNIQLELVYDSSVKDYTIHLEAHSGDIILDIPKGIPGNITSKIYQANSVKDLNSEIPLEIRLDNEKIIGTSINDNGTIPIHIEAYNGIITIKET